MAHDRSRIERGIDMSVAKLQPAGSESPSEAMRAAWRDAHVRPLWESPIAHTVRAGGPKPHLWPWRVLEPLVADAVRVASLASIERRVLMLVDPEADADATGTTTNLTAALQILLPGEQA